MKRLVLLTCAWLMSACAAHTPLPDASPTLVQPLPVALQVSTADEQHWLLVIQAEGHALRWSLFDPLGMPLARQTLVDGAWHNDGLLPPNAAARELFAALLFALTPRAELARHYAQADWQEHSPDSRKLAPNWRIRYEAALSIHLDNGQQHYRTSPLETHP